MNYKFIFSTILLALLASACNSPISAQASTSATNPTGNIQPAPTTARAGQTTTSNDTRGYVLFAPLRSTTTYLINFDGNIVHT